MCEYLREAAEEDMDLLFTWANDPEVRKNSFSTGNISYEEHKRWFAQLMQDGSRKQYIYMADGEPAGQIRLDLQGDTAEVSYSICAGKRGKGHGKKMIGLLRELLREESCVRTLTAKVKAGNPASERAFLADGYRKAYTLFERGL